MVQRSSSLSNLIKFTNRVVPISIHTVYDDVALGSSNLHNYPFLYLTGHGTITANNSEVQNLRTYLEHGGFLYVDDDYGLDSHIRNLMNRVFLTKNSLNYLLIIPSTIKFFSLNMDYLKYMNMTIKTPRGYGLFYEGKLVMYYTYESNLGDGWADVEVHNNPPQKREEALKMVLIF